MKKNCKVTKVTWAVQIKFPNVILCSQGDIKGKKGPPMQVFLKFEVALSRKCAPLSMGPSLTHVTSGKQANGVSLHSFPI